MKLGDLFSPCELPGFGYVGERCRLCGLTFDETQRLTHARDHAAAGALEDLGGSPEDPAYTFHPTAGRTIDTLHARDVQTRAEPVAVHVLHHGRPLCGFTTDVPRDWPSGVWWCRLEEAAEDATCTACQDRVAVLAGQLEL